MKNLKRITKGMAGLALATLATIPARADIISDVDTAVSGYVSSLTTSTGTLLILGLAIFAGFLGVRLLKRAGKAAVS